MKEYKTGNKHATDLLLHGFQEKNSLYIASELIDRALQGDEEAKLIIYAQINTLRGIPTSNSTFYAAPVVVPINSSRR